MHVSEEARYRMRLAEGFLNEARQDVELKRWRSCIDNSQLATENAGKAALALLGPVGRTHNPAVLLRQALEDGRYPPEARSQIEQIAERSEILGPDVHIESDYGDETGWQTPWELFDEGDARDALRSAEEAVLLLQQLTAHSARPPQSEMPPHLDG